LREREREREEERERERESPVSILTRKCGRREKVDAQQKYYHGGI
jgi:hypothetical protein